MTPPKSFVDFGRHYSPEHVQVMREIYSSVCTELDLDGEGRREARRAIARVLLESIRNGVDDADILKRAAAAAARSKIS
jgi:hypothetical protein